MTIAEYKTQITDEFMSNASIAEAYGFTAGDAFDNVFSKVSIESILFYIVAVVHKIIGDAQAVFKSEQQKAIHAAIVANDRWWYDQVMAYVLGASLTYNSTTYKFSLVTDDDSTTLVAYCAILQAINENQVTYLKIMCAKVSYEVLSTAETTALTEYLKRVAPAGVIFIVESNTPDIIYFPANGETSGIQIYYDPMLLDSNGMLLSDGATYPVNVAIDAYIKGIIYGGKFNVTKLIDAIQSATGVVDVKVNLCKIHKFSDAAGVGSEISTTVDLAAGVGEFSIDNATYVSNIGYFPQSAL
jgi:hypothetical protein